MREKRLAMICVALGFLLMAFAVARAGDAEDAEKEKRTDPRDGRVPLDAAPGWDASLVLDNDGTGVWTVGSFKVFPHLACPEVIGLDDKGRCWVLVSYSGRWTPFPTVFDGKWLGGLAHGDVDPRRKGPETYVGSQRGNIYQVVGYSHGALDNRLIAHLSGREIHTIVARGQELIVFTRPGGLFRITPTGKDGRFETKLVQELPGRVRDAVLLPDGSIATVSRKGRLRLLRLTEKGPQWTTIYEAPMGKGRIAHQGGVLYTTHDDGRVLRHERRGNEWRTETIYNGPQGPRGIAAGRFYDDAAVESVAVFGYSGKVQLLSRRDTLWKVETLFEDTDKGHWLCAAELDGRNGTLELISSGYSGRIVLLARPPGYGAPAPGEPRQ